MSRQGPHLDLYNWEVSSCLDLGQVAIGKVLPTTAKQASLQRRHLFKHPTSQFIWLPSYNKSEIILPQCFPLAPCVHVVFVTVFVLSLSVSQQFFNQPPQSFHQAPPLHLSRHKIHSGSPSNRSPAKISKKLPSLLLSSRPWDHCYHQDLETPV